MSTESIDRAAALRLTGLRLERGWSQAETARRITAEGVPKFHPGTVARIEAGERPLRLSEAVGVGRAFGLSLDELLALPEGAAALRQLEADAEPARYEGLLNGIASAWLAVQAQIEGIDRDLADARAAGVDVPDELAQRLDHVRQALGRLQQPLEPLADAASEARREIGLPWADHDSWSGSEDG